MSDDSGVTAAARDASTAPAAERRRRFRRAWLVTFAATMVVAVVWIIAQPPYSGSDEPAHFAEAQA
ncbi:MAG: hypothetical protein M3Y91_01875, partial [Actinomycetota bacterium]|nr:hypothetical protein [Actinomycetota bacterium]